MNIPFYTLWKYKITQPEHPAFLCPHALMMIVFGRIVLFFISLLGLQFVSGVIFLFFTIVLEWFDDLCNRCEGECVCMRVYVCTVARWMCVCGCVREEKNIGCVVWWLSAPNAHQPFACVHHCASVFRCSLASASIHPNERDWEERTGEEEEEEEGLFPLGEKTQMRKDTFKKMIFFSSAGSQWRV